MNAEERIAEIAGRHEPVRGYPVARNPEGGHTYTAIVEQWCERCYTEWPCDAAQLLDLVAELRGRLEAGHRVNESLDRDYLAAKAALVRHVGDPPVLAQLAALTAERDALRSALESSWAHHGVSHRAVGSACVGTDREVEAALAARALLRPSEPTKGTTNDPR